MRSRRRLAVSFASGVALSLAMPAGATTLYSIWGSYGPIAGIPYANRSDVSDNVVMAAAGTVKSTNGATIPGGWSSVRSTLYKNGLVCAAGKDSFYTRSATSWSGGSITGYCGSGTYTGKVVTGAYNGNGYSYYYGYVSPHYAH